MGPAGIHVQILSIRPDFERQCQHLYLDSNLLGQVRNVDIWLKNVVRGIKESIRASGAGNQFSAPSIFRKLRMQHIKNLDRIFSYVNPTK